MDDRLIPPAGDADPSGIADAEALFRESPPPLRASPAPAPARAENTGGQYDVEDLAEPASAPPSPLPPIEPPRAKPAANQATAAKAKPNTDPSETVDQVWSRWAEWGGSVVALVVVDLAFLAGVYFLLSAESYGLGFLLLVAMAPASLFLAYPILVTLERPVRITPEQAVRDYFTALSHHGPHYRRMWLLLSKAGRVSGEYASFEGFRAYWKRRLAGLRSGRASGFTPLKFQVVDFKSPKSAGLSAIDATFTVNVSVRGRQGEGPFESVKVETSLVKGPDRMWYLDTGTLP